MLTVDRVNGYSALVLENDRMRAVILPEKGADIYALVYKPADVDFLMKTPAGLRPPGTRPLQGFLENYEGGWQELFPNVGRACCYRGRMIPMHGEVALLSWTVLAVRDDSMESAVCLTVRCRETPFRLERWIRLAPGRARLELTERGINEGDALAHFVWGHHIVLGGDFLERGCRLEIPARTLITPEEPFDPPATRLAPGQRGLWPVARGREPGERFDLREIPGPEARSHDDVLLTGLSQGRAAVVNPRLGLAFQLEWDAALFRWVILWQPFGGARVSPLEGVYGLGVEPWSSRFDLEQAVRRGEALALAPGESLATTLRVRVASASAETTDGAGGGREVL